MSQVASHVAVGGAWVIVGDVRDLPAHLLDEFDRSNPYRLLWPRIVMAPLDRTTDDIVVCDVDMQSMTARRNPYRCVIIASAGLRASLEATIWEQEG
jgi:hypothetical protein